MTNRLLVTTVVRYADLAQDSGYLYLLDWDTKQQLLATPMPESIHRAQDANPRGGLRGARGISAWGNRLALANSERLFFLDEKWQPFGEFSHPWLGGIHDILAQEDGVWVTSTNADLLVKVSWGGKIMADWCWREDSVLREALGLPGLPPMNRGLDFRMPAAMRSGVHNTVHLNSVSPAPDDGLLLSFGRIRSPAGYRQVSMQGWLGGLARSLGLPQRRRRVTAAGDLAVGEIAGCSAAIVWLRASGESEIVLQAQNTTVPNHNVWLHHGRLLYNDSNHSALVARPLESGGTEQRITVPGNPGFARGLALSPAGTALVGSQAPAAVCDIDLDTLSITDEMTLSSRPTESVFALCLLPEEFTAPSDRLRLFG